MRPLHICFICNEYPPAPHGGIGTFTQTLARALVQRGHRVTVFGMHSDRPAGTESDGGVEVVRISRRGLPLLRFALNRRKFAEAYRRVHAAHPIDIVEGAEIDVWLLSRSLPGVKVLRMHGGPTFFATGIRIQVLKEGWGLRAVQHLCAVSHCVADGTRRMLKLGNRPIEVIPNPINTEVFAPVTGDVAEEDGLILFAGTITERKGIRQLIQAMPRIVAEAPQAHLEVYGGEAIDPPPSEPMTPRLIQMMPAEVAAHVEWKGRVERTVLPRAIRRASICVYPSHIEAMPIAWLEGLAAGKAVVASQTGPGPEIIDDGITGLLCNPHDPDSIASAILRLLKDPELRRRLGAAAREMAMERYSLEKIVDRNLEYYAKITQLGS